MHLGVLTLVALVASAFASVTSQPSDTLTPSPTITAQNAFCSEYKVIKTIEPGTADYARYFHTPEFNELEIAKLLDAYTSIYMSTDPDDMDLDMSIFTGTLDILHFNRGHPEQISWPKYQKIAKVIAMKAHPVLKKSQREFLRGVKLIVQNLWPSADHDVNGMPRLEISEKHVIDFARLSLSESQIQKLDASNSRANSMVLVQEMIKDMPYKDFDPERLDDMIRFIKSLYDFNESSRLLFRKDIDDVLDVLLVSIKDFYMDFLDDTKRALWLLYGFNKPYQNFILRDLKAGVLKKMCDLGMDVKIPSINPCVKVFASFNTGEFLQKPFQWLGAMGSKSKVSKKKSDAWNHSWKDTYDYLDTPFREHEATEADESTTSEDAITLKARWFYHDGSLLFDTSMVTRKDGTRSSNFEESALGPNGHDDMAKSLTKPNDYYGVLSFYSQFMYYPDGHAMEIHGIQRGKLVSRYTIQGPTRYSPEISVITSCPSCIDQ